MVMRLIARAEAGIVYFSKFHIPEKKRERERISVSSESFLLFLFQPFPFATPSSLLARTALFPPSPTSLRFFLPRAPLPLGIARPPPTLVQPSLSYFCPFSSRAAPLTRSHLPLPRPFSGPVGKARETFIFARRKSKAEREVLPADRYCEADVFCDNSVIRERVRERREKLKAPRCSLARSFARSLIRDLHRAIRTAHDS